ncbi:glycosyltransferase family 2 protein [Clostridium botulinum]|uniref:glycosyltransferase family 2 protein n=1 Tax=Clostridium botulinum TaxID=1491 RepID=UPI0019685042|nr:glycosyltransferase family 2 protein [Clostridium botulinum]MBN1060033.1 glycosyltransferase family 2 protein [Clostridium botulinum]MBN1063179.1 glycosyltransferase family 2 protein [Clostridium botulinum]
MDISIIIVNWNTSELLINCVESIKKETLNIKYEIIIYDNNSKDNSIELVEKKYDNIKIIKGKENLGFSKANNKAVNICNGKYVLLLNPDTIILDNAIEKTFEFIQQYNKKNVLVGCKLLNKDLSTQLSAARFPSIYNYTVGRTSNIEINNSTHKCDWVMGAFMMLSKNTYNMIGGFDESYFMYCEDMDICYKIYKNFGEVYFFNEAQIIHLYNQSGEKKWKGNREEALRKSSFIFINKNKKNFISRNLLKLIYNLKYFLKKYLR